MEPIRPDDEDLRATPTTKKATSAGKAEPPAHVAQPNTHGRPVAVKSKGVVVLTLLMVVLAVALAGVWLEQGRRISALEGQLEEADYWARQSKLALARFEGTLNKTGESLEETGSTMAQKLEQLDVELKTANSEVRKLWVVANERNKKRLDDQQGQLQTVQASLASQQADVKKWLEGLDALKADITKQVTAIELANASTREQVGAVAQSVAGVDGQITKRLERFEQEQKLGKAEVASRLLALEKDSADAASKTALSKAQRQITELESTIKSIDASRAQLTSRLIRLTGEVDALRAGSN